jgi:tetratricopeptide (TPR) repeat protein
MCSRPKSLYEKSKGKNSIEYAEALLYAGELDCRQSQLVKAEEKFVRALHICKQVGKTDTNVAAALNADLGYCRSDRGLYAEALPPLQIARRLYLSRSGSECPNLVQLNKYLTEIYKHLQQEKSGRGTERLQPHG